ncbi:MAG: hypothetical protein K6E11_03800 [Bacilli bacterium]|nr:hypothetical protein [Bacilli bacterium]
MIEIIEVKNKSMMKKFVTFPLKLYKDNVNYVPSLYVDEMNLLKPKKNLMLGNCIAKCFLAIKDNKVVGRVCAIISPDSNASHNEKCISFSRLDMIDDIEVTKALLDAVIKFGKENGLNEIHGPWGFNDADREGMLTFGFDEYSTFGTAYSFEYYHKHMEALGYKKESEWSEYRIYPKEIDPRYKRIAEHLKKRNYIDIVKQMPLKKVIKKYGDKFFECYNRAYANLDNFVPVDGRQRKSMLKTFATILNPHFFCLLINEKDDVIAFAVGLPYIGEVIHNCQGKIIKGIFPLLRTIKNPDRVELALIAVDPIYQNSGVHALMLANFGDDCVKYNVKDVVADPILTTNIKTQNIWAGSHVDLRAKRQTYRKVIQ